MQFYAICKFSVNSALLFTFYFTENTNDLENIIEEMEKNVLKNSVFHIFDLVTRMKHKIVKISHEKSLKGTPARSKPL